MIYVLSQLEWKMIKLTLVFFYIFILVSCDDIDIDKPFKLGKFEITIVRYKQVVSKPIVNTNDTEFSCLSKVPQDNIHEILNISRIPIYVRVGFFQYTYMKKSDCDKLINCLLRERYADLLYNCISNDKFNRRTSVKYKIVDDTIEETIDEDTKPVRTFRSGECYSEDNNPVIIGNIKCKRGLITVKFIGIIEE